MKQTSYYPSLEQRSRAAISNNAAADQLEALIAETERAFDAAPDPESLQAMLLKLKTAHTQARARINWIV